MEGVVINIDLKKLGLKKDSDWDHEPISDAHVGDPNCNYDKLAHTIERISSQKNRSTHLMGDNTANIRADDFRFNLDASGLQPVIKQVTYLRKMFEPIWNHNKDNVKCWGAQIGNHEYNGRAKMTEEQYKREYCYEIGPKEGGMGLNYLGTLAYIWVNFFWGKKKDSLTENKIRDYRILTAHGQYKGSQSGGELNQMKRFPAGHENFDVFFTGDSHDKKDDSSILQSAILVDGKIKLKKRKVFFISCGTFQETFMLGYTNYPEKSPYYARISETGTKTVTFNPYLGKLYCHG